MNSCKRLKFLSACTTISTVVLYCAIMFQSISIMDFQYTQILLFSAQSLLLLTIIFIVCTILISKGIFDSAKGKKIIVASVMVVLLGCVSSITYGFLTCYNCYTPEDILENNKTYIQSLFPAHNITDAKSEIMDLEVSHIPGSDYIYLYCYGTLDYEVEYFKSASPFMNWKFKTERSILTPLNEFDMDILVTGKEMEVDGIKLTVFIDANGYAALIKSFNQAIYVSLLNASADKILVDDFAREVIKQMKLLENATKEKVFLDVPFSEAF